MQWSYNQVLAFAKKSSSKKVAQSSSRFFKSGKGEYGEGMKFLGVRAADQTKIAKQCMQVSQATRKKMLTSEWHEIKLIGLRLMVLLYQEKAKQSRASAAKIYKEYLGYFPHINNWDLVDVSCHKVIGPELEEKSRKVLYKWARSRNMWVRRISMVSTWHFIRMGELDDCFSLAELLLGDSHDLMHKAVGWMLREAGKKDRKRLNRFLDKYAPTMPRVTLRYAIERHTEGRRKIYLAAKKKQGDKSPCSS